MKPAEIYIGKILKAAVVLSAAVALIGGSVLCCCIAKVASAATVKKGCCHKAQKTAPTKACDHCKVKSADSDTLIKSLDLVPAFVKSFHVEFIAAALMHLPQGHLSSLAYTGPPRANMSLPIYLQFSNLRL
jgi:hypothetical protein